jgi:transcriptional regulator with XRE-family HTH domain
MKKLNMLFQELGISKVRLAKYLGVSRQMVYNYLELDDLNKWPKEKKLLLYKLLDINDKTDLNAINVSTDYLMSVESRLNQGVKNTSDYESYLDLKDLDKDSQELLMDMINLIKEKLTDDNAHHEYYYSFLYLYHMLQSMDNVPEIKYMFGYMSKTTGFTDPEEYKFEEDKQFIFEGILFSALTLYNNGGASRSRLQDTHNRWVQEIEQKAEEKLSRTQQLNSIKIQALSELGYTELTKENAEEVLEKMAEIESRKV